jgi:sialic acid synthase
MLIRTTFETANNNINIGDGFPPYLISEIGLNHNGNFNLAKELIYESALNGATFVKFQKRFPNELAVDSFLDEPFNKCPAFGNTQRQVREKLELTLEEYKKLKNYTESFGMIFCASAFDIQSLRFLLEAGVEVIKIASHSITNGPLLREAADSKCSIICSFGGTKESERDIAYYILKDNPLVILHCVSAYPTPDNLSFLDTILYYKERYNVPVGFSSHENGIDISVASSLLGACMIERHFTLSRSMIGLDHGISLEPHEFKELSLKVKRMQSCRGINKKLLVEETAAKLNYHTGIYSTKNLKKGHRVTMKDICCKQPLKDPELYFSGLEYQDIISKIVKKDVEKDQLIPKTAIDLSL